MSDSPAFCNTELGIVLGLHEATLDDFAVSDEVKETPNLSESTVKKWGSKYPSIQLLANNGKIQFLEAFNKFCKNVNATSIRKARRVAKLRQRNIEEAIAVAIRNKPEPPRGRHGPRGTQ
jgi:hypothetical protein